MEVSGAYMGSAPPPKLGSFAAIGYTFSTAFCGILKLTDLFASTMVICFLS